MTPLNMCDKCSKINLKKIVCPCGQQQLLDIHQRLLSVCHAFCTVWLEDGRWMSPGCSLVNYSILFCTILLMGFLIQFVLCFFIFIDLTSGLYTVVIGCLPCACLSICMCMYEAHAYIHTHSNTYLNTQSIAQTPRGTRSGYIEANVACNLLVVWKI